MWILTLSFWLGQRLQNAVPVAEIFTVEVSKQLKMELTRKFLVQNLKDKGISPGDSEYPLKLQSAILEFHGLEQVNVKDFAHFKQLCYNLSQHIKDRFKKAGRHYDRLFRDCHAFFDGVVKKPEVVQIKKRSYANVGAPSKPFEEKGATAQYLEAKKLKESASSSKAVFKAAKLAADSEGLKDLSFVYKKVIEEPSVASEIRASISNPKQGNFLFTLVFLINAVIGL